MVKITPEFTLPLGAFPGFSGITQAAITGLLGSKVPTGRLQGLIVRPRRTTNTTDPHEVGVLYREDCGGLKVCSGFQAPHGLLTLVAQTAYLVSHDPLTEKVCSAARANAMHGSFDRVAVFGFGCVAWDSRRCHAERKDDAGFRRSLNAGNAFAGLVAARHDRSAHERLGDIATFGALASEIYAMEIEALSGRKQTGLHRRVRFATDGTLRTPHLGP
jgi:hypothetical protein